MREIEDSVKKFRERYDKYGYDDPDSVTTNICCNKRLFWKRALDLTKGKIDGQHIREDDLNKIEVVDLPYEALVAMTSKMAFVFVGWISPYLISVPQKLKVIVVNGEWHIGLAKMELLITSMLNYKVYLFHLAEIYKRGDTIPTALKQLLEDPTVNKVGNRIQNDVNKLKGWAVALKPIVELGNLAHARGVTPTKSRGLETIVDSLWPGVEVEGKHGPDSARFSDWDQDL